MSLVNPADCDCANANQKAKILSLRGGIVDSRKAIQRARI